MSPEMKRARQVLIELSAKKIVRAVYSDRQLEEVLSDFCQRGIESDTPAHDIDGLEAASRHKPGARIGRYAVLRPLLHGGGKGFV